MKLNRVELSGNVGSIDVFENEGKRPFARVSLAENNQYTNKNGEKVEKTTWHKLVFYGKVVSIVKDKVSKGSQLIVIGRLDYQNWETDDGQKRQTAFVVVDQFDVKNKERPVDVNHDDPEVPFFELLDKFEKEIALAACENADKIGVLTQADLEWIKGREY